MRLIDADALLNDSSIVYHTEFGDAVVDVEDIKKAPTIKTFTLADIEDQYRKGLEKGLEEARPHGEWEQIPERDGEYYFYHKCTNCGQTLESGFNPPLFNFCPNCGADMRKEGEANEDNRI